MIDAIARQQTIYITQQMSNEHAYIVRLEDGHKIHKKHNKPNEHWIWNRQIGIDCKFLTSKWILIYLIQLYKTNLHSEHYIHWVGLLLWIFMCVRRNNSIQPIMCGFVESCNIVFIQRSRFFTRFISIGSSRPFRTKRRGEWTWPFDKGKIL